MISVTATHLLAFVPSLLLIEGFFAGSEIALLSADQLALKHQSKEGSTGATLALQLIQFPEKILSTTLFITSLCVISLSTLMTLYFIEQAPSHSHLFTLLVTSPLIVLFGELIPKTLYQYHATVIARWVARPIHWMYWACFPWTWILTFYMNRLSRIAGPLEKLLVGKRKTTREELHALLSYNRSEIKINPIEKRMIKRIFNFKETEAKHALIPLVKVEAIIESATIHEALQNFENHRHSRIPVYSERIDNIIGLLKSSNLLAATHLEESIQPYISPAHYVAETQILEDVMVEMRQKNHEMVVIVNEYGGGIGILTFEDIVEEIVGEINDEFDHESKDYKEISSNSWHIQAKMEIQTIHEILKIEIPEGDYETLGGFLLQEFGRIPNVGDTMTFTTAQNTYQICIQKASRRQIETVLIQRTNDEDKTPE